MTPNDRQAITREVTSAIKGRMVSLTALEILNSDLEELDQQLREKAALAPAFFRHAPMLLDFEHVGSDIDIAWLESACELVTSNAFVPVGITGADRSLEDAARAQGMAIWPPAGAGQQEAVPEKATPEESPVAPATAPAHPVTQVIKRPVRSGQRVYAQGSDLIVLASVSTGAEILADGHIHVYGTLRGRALAGVQGNENARIFCSDLQADLVAIAGYYIINDDLPADKRNRAVQIFLSGEHLQIESI